MLLNLKLQDLILVEKAEIVFGKGLNIITGETGSGKSAILSAIRLLAGERVDLQCIRTGANMAVVEGQFSGQMIIRREIYASGKSRSFLDDRLVSASCLKEYVASQLEMVDQNSSHSLKSEEVQRNMLDTFANLQGDVALLAKMIADKKELEASLAAQETLGRELEWAKSNLQEILDVNWQKDEEEELQKSHYFLTNTEELTEKISHAMDGLTNATLEIARLSQLLEQAAILDPNLNTIAATLKTSYLETDEVQRFLASYSQNLEADPKRLEAIEARIGAIEKIKRRFGATGEEVENRKISLQKEINILESLDISQQKQKLQTLVEQSNQLAAQISAKRKIAAEYFSAKILEELKSLNLNHALFEVCMNLKPLSSNGIDSVSFQFSANPGVMCQPVEDHASGGEISRLLFAVKLISGQKKCFVFDEIDSNIGGQTAAIFGEKLEELSQNTQVICVTHFVQVAHFAKHHFLSSKKEDQGKAITLIEKLVSKELREIEYERMIGKARPR